MNDIFRAIPDLDLLYALEPEELGAKILFVLRSRPAGSVPLTGLADLWEAGYSDANPSTPRFDVRHRILTAFSEAVAWLKAQGLVLPDPTQQHTTDHFVLSRRAKSFENQSQFGTHVLARTISRELLNPRIRDQVWAALMRGEFDVAVFLAMKAVEVAVREASGLQDKLGVDLMRKAFDRKNGPLTAPPTPEGERDACSALFAGASGSFKNPQSHREVGIEEAQEALEVVLLANHLLRIVDRRNPSPV